MVEVLFPIFSAGFGDFVRRSLSRLFPPWWCVVLCGTETD